MYDPEKQAESRQRLEVIRQAMRDAGDRYVIAMVYQDAEGVLTRRVVSPIRFTSGQRFLALCLCRQEPREFRVQRCFAVELTLAAQYVMPVPMERVVIDDQRMTQSQ